MTSNQNRTTENKAVLQALDASRDKEAYKFHILITKDEIGIFSAIVLNLPGTGSCGDTEEEAMENVKEAISGVLAEYEDSHVAIPWKDTSSVEMPLGGKQRWISLDE